MKRCWGMMAMVLVLVLSQVGCADAPDRVSFAGTLNKEQIEMLREQYPLARSMQQAMQLVSFMSLELEQIVYESDCVAIVEITKGIWDIEMDYPSSPEVDKENKESIEEYGVFAFPEKVRYQQFKIRIEKMIWAKSDEEYAKGMQPLKQGEEYTVRSYGPLEKTLPQLVEGAKYIFSFAQEEKGGNFDGALSMHPEVSFYITDNGQVLSSFSETKKNEQYSGMLLADFINLVQEKILAYKQERDSRGPIPPVPTLEGNPKTDDLPPTPVPMGD